MCVLRRLAPWNYGSVDVAASEAMATACSVFACWSRSEEYLIDGQTARLVALEAIETMMSPVISSTVHITF